MLLSDGPVDDSLIATNRVAMNMFRGTGNNNRTKWSKSLHIQKRSSGPESGGKLYHDTWRWGYKVGKRDEKWERGEQILIGMESGTGQAWGENGKERQAFKIEKHNK